MRLLCQFTALLIAMVAQAQDLNIKKNISVGGYVVSSTETALKGSRERTVSQGANGSTITLRQCDLKRTLTLNEQAQTYMAINDPQDENAARAAALATGSAATEASGGKVIVTTTVTDTGERKTLYGYQARHLKAKVVQEPSAEACTQVRQSFEIDGWFADINKDQAACATIAPPVQQGKGCSDVVIARRTGSGKPGYPLQETISMPAPDGSTMTVSIQVSDLSKQALPAELFEVPAGYRQVSSVAELNGGLPAGASASQAMAQGMPQGSTGVSQRPTVAQMMNPATQVAMQQNAMAFGQQAMGAQNAHMTTGMPGMMGGGASGGSQIATPQALGPKAPGRIRIGVAPPDAQMGQGSKSGADYSTPIRNAIVALMSGPAVEIAALDAHVPLQLQAEAQQKQCDYILFSSVEVKHGSSGGIGGFMKKAAPLTNLTPMGMAAHGMGAAVAAQAAGAAASAAAMSAQQQAVSQLAGFNGEIKSKDNVAVQYQLTPTGQSVPVSQESLQGKAKSDGEDVLTPLLQHTAETVLTQVTTKK
jgi:hypothetical protein